MMINKKLWLTLFLCAAVLSGCPENKEDIKGGEPVNIYPIPGSKNVHIDGEFMIVFDNVPTLTEDDYIRIYESGKSEPADEIRIFQKRTGFNNDTNPNEDKGTVQLFPNSSVNEGNARPQDKPGFRGIHQAFTRTWVTEKDNRTLTPDPEKSTALFITPTHGALQYGKTYRVEIDYGVITDAFIGGVYFFGFYKGSPQGEWTFTTREAPKGLSASKPITVDASMNTESSSDFRTVWGALAWIRSAPQGDYTINVAPGVYNEMINYHTPAANASNITINGTGTAKYGADVVIQWLNHTHINGGSGSTHWRGVVYFSGPKNIVLKNLTIKNLDEHSGGQAEALMFGNATGNTGDTRAVFNCGFYGHQDTLLTNGRCWFYQCYIEGDTDFIWGSSDTALFEECELEVVYCAASPTRGGHIFAARVNYDDRPGTRVAPKGYVILNSTLRNNSNGIANFGRTQADNPPTRWDQAAVINTAVLPGHRTGANTFNTGLWSVTTTSGFIGKGENAGYKAYNITKPDGTPFTNAVHADTSMMTETLYNAEYSGRHAVLNSVFNTVTGLYQPAVFQWDISKYENEFNAVPDAGK